MKYTSNDEQCAKQCWNNESTVVTKSIEFVLVRALTTLTVPNVAFSQEL
jgi:hypothetical protein